SYMAPEYIQHGLSSSQGDLWAVGVMLYQCLTGERPFGGDNTTTILFKIVSTEPPLLDPVTIQGISPSIQGILTRALSKDPAHRFKTAEEFAKSLRACQDPAWEGNLEGTVMLAAIPLDPDATSYLAKTPRQPLPHASVTPTQPTRGRTGLLTALGAGLLALAGAGAYFFAGSRPAAPAAAMEGNTVPLIPSVSAATSAPAGPATAAPVAGAKPTAPAPSAAASAPAAGTAQPQSLSQGQAQTTATPPAPNPTPSVPSAETSAEKLAKAVAVMPSDPDLAAELLLNLAAAQPGQAPIQGNLLAALYRIGNARDFERALDTARANGLSGPQMMKAAPAFRQAMTDELRAHKAKDKSNVLTLATLNKIVN
ncbi:MAG: protein kinase, partial [Betaproteobacteria bacterium]